MYVRNLSEIEQSPAELLIILRIFAHVMLRYDFWSLDLELLQHFDCHAFMLCTKFERNRIIHSWVIGDLAPFRRAILGVGHRARLTNGSQGCVDPTSPNLARTIGRSFLHDKFVSAFRYLAAFSNVGGSKWSDIENDAKFHTFDPRPVKTRGGVGRY